MKKYKTLIFDLDDTLTNNTESIRYAFEQVINRMEGKYSDELFLRWSKFDADYWHSWEKGTMILPETIKTLEDRIRYLRGNRFVRFFKEEGIEIEFEFAVELNEIYCEMMGVNIIEIKNAKKLLQELCTEYEIIVATNGPKVAAYNKVERAGLMPYVSFVLCSEEVGFSKPMPEFYDLLFARAENKDKETMLMIGDTLTTDVLGGMKNGIDTCWLNWERIPVPEGYHPTMVIHELLELKEKLKACCQ